MTEKIANLTPGMIAKRYGVDVKKVLGWINTEELHAINVATKSDGGMPRWKIYPEDLEKFEARRSSIPEASPKRKPRTKRDDKVIKFY